MRQQAPTRAALEEIRAHLEDVHGWTEFDPGRDIAFPESTPDGACVAYLPATRFARARFICSCCNGGIFIEGQPSAFGFAQDRLAHPTTIWITPNDGTRKLALFVFAFHDTDEIGPKMLARIAKHTGLAPDDL